MKKFLSVILRFLIIVAIIALGVLLVLKIRKDTLIVKNNYEETQNIQNESEFIIKSSEKSLADIKNKIEEELKVEVELADSGSVTSIDIYFVTLVDDEYKNIIKVQKDGKDVFAIANDNYEDGKYIVAPDKIGFEECVYTKLDNYNIDKNGHITYIN